MIINITYDELTRIVEIEVEKEMKNILLTQHKRIRLAIEMIDMLEEGLDKSYVVSILKKALGE